MERNLFSLKNDIVHAGKRMYDRGYVASNDGNMSARIDDRRILITPSGVSKGFLNQNELAIIDYDGKLIFGSKKPSSEFKMHLRIYKERKDVNSVCHSHPPYATGFAVAGLSLEEYVLPEVIIALGKIPLVEYGTPGTDELYNPLIPLLSDHDAFLLSNHGVVTLGQNVLDAYHKMETVEHFAKICFIARALGNVNTLDNLQVAKLIAFRENFGVRPDVGLASRDNNNRSLMNSAKEDSAREELVRKITEEILDKLSKK